jgi:hypothetical protein
MESIAPVLLTIRLDKAQSITIMHGNGNRVRDHQAKYHHRSCMGMETMEPLHHHIQIVKNVSIRTTIWVWTSSRCTVCYFCFVDKYLFVILFSR